MANDQQVELEIGDLAKDTGRNKVGVVMGELGGYVLLRPLNGGIEWEVRPSKLVPLTPREELSARLAVRNAQSEIGRGQ
jgi:predicted sugar kinase